MCPTECKRDRPTAALRIGEAAVGSIAVGLQHAGVTLQQRRSVFGTTPRRVAVYHRGWRPAPPRPVIAGQHPEVTLLSAPASGEGRVCYGPRPGSAPHQAGASFGPCTSCDRRTLNYVDR